MEKVVNVSEFRKMEEPCCARRLVRPNVEHTSLMPEMETLRWLEKLGEDRVFSIVSLSGSQREGKSFLMNLLHGRGNKFKTGHQMDPETTGLWMVESEDVIYIDTEGLDSPHVPQFYNWCLSALSCLISDCFLYQSRGSIDARHVDRLEVILQVSEQLMKEDESSREAGKRPSFAWILRDHHLEMRTKDSKAEMMSKLTESAQIALNYCFEDVECFFLPTPCGAKTLKHLDTMERAQLDHDFIKQLEKLETFVVRKLEAKRKASDQSHDISGPKLARIIRLYCSLIENRVGILAGIADLPTRNELLSTVARERAIRAGLEVYKETMEASKGFLGTRHDLSCKHARLAFEKFALGDMKSPGNVEAFLKMENDIAKWASDVWISDGNGKVVKMHALEDGLLCSFVEDLKTEFERSFSSQSFSSLSDFDRAFQRFLEQNPDCSRHQFECEMLRLRQNLIVHLLEQANKQVLLEVCERFEKRLQQTEKELDFKISASFKRRDEFAQDAGDFVQGKLGHIQASIENLQGMLDARVARLKTEISKIWSTIGEISETILIK